MFDLHFHFGHVLTEQIGIFCKLPFCEREDVHSCNIRGHDPSYCMQVNLKLPPIQMTSGAQSSVTGLICVSTYYPYSHLWATDSSGQLTIWDVPQYGLGFHPAHTEKIHDGAINNLVHTQRHAITISDDGMISLFDLYSFARVRTIDIMEWGNYRNLLERPDVRRKIKSVHLEEDHVNGGNMVLGTSYGDIIMLKLGVTV